jgi:hypothetical protein
MDQKPEPTAAERKTDLKQSGWKLSERGAVKGEAGPTWTVTVKRGGTTLVASAPERDSAWRQVFDLAAATSDTSRRAPS